MDRQGMLVTGAGLRAGLAETWGAVDGLVGGLDAAGWAAPTGCPGWTVRDCVSHIASIEHLLLGEEPPDHPLPEGLAHVTDGFKRFTEVGVDLRRGWSVDGVLADFRAVTAARLGALETITETELAEPRTLLLGTMPLRSVLGIRVFDCWSHEQDVRRALRRPGGLDGLTGPHARERLFRGICAAIQRGVQPAAGTTVLVEVVGPSAGSAVLRFDGEAGRIVDEAGGGPAVSLRLDLATLTVLGCGRHDDPEAAGRVEVGGDAELGRRMLAHMAFTP